MIYVPGQGPCDAKLMIVGEAPGKDEELVGRPFVGASGMIVDKCLLSAGISRNSVYATNVVKIRPPGNDIKKLHLLDKKIEDFLPQLWDEISALKPNCILAFGNTALQALTGMNGIEKWRGSILPSNHGYPKVIGTIHPAAMMHKEAEGKLRAWKDLTFIQWDVNRAVEESKTKEIVPPRRILRVCKNSLDLIRFIEDGLARGNKVSVDIETYRTFPLCIGLAFDNVYGMCVPLFNVMGPENTEGIPRSDLAYCWKIIADLLNCPEHLKIGQNFKFDQLQLERCYNGTVNFGFPVRGMYFDTHLGFRTLYPELPASLGFITSVLTKQPYYKDEGKEYNPKKDKLDRLLLYCAQDAVTTYECYEQELIELREKGLEDFFFTKIMPLHSFYMRIEARGILQDKAAQQTLDKKYERQQKLEQVELEYLIGVPINVASPKQVHMLLFLDLKVPMRAGTDEDTLDALIRNTVKDPKIKRIITLILSIRKIRKTRGTYVNCEVHHDNRLRTGYRIMLETGRTSTSVLKPPVTTETMGLAFQTITKHGEIGSDIRSMFIPDEGYVFLEPDLSQAEARVISHIADDKKQNKMYKFGLDVHLVTFSWLENISVGDLLDKFFYHENEEELFVLAREINKQLWSKISEEQRQIGKKLRHAYHLGMKKREAGRQLGISEWKAGKLLEKMLAFGPEIKTGYHDMIVDYLRQSKDRSLTNPFGRKRQFLNKWGDDLFKEAWAQLPQSTVSDHLKFSAQRIERRLPSLMIFQESHDSFLAQIPIAHVDCAARVIKEELETPIDFKLCSFPRGELIIPSDIKFSDTNWEEMRKMN